MDSYQGIPLFFSSTETTSCSAWYLKHTGEQEQEKSNQNEKKELEKLQKVLTFSRSGSLHVSTSPCSLVMQVKILLYKEKVLNM